MPALEISPYTLHAATTTSEEVVIVNHSRSIQGDITARATALRDVEAIIFTALLAESKSWLYVRYFVELVTEKIFSHCLVTIVRGG
jgi:hypothetical protein